MQTEAIETILPHSDPFLFVRNATLSEDSAEAIYTITGDEFFLKGHFKEEPIFPASIMIEALGQLAVLFLLTTKKTELTQPVDNKKVMFVSCERTTCHAICRPGDTLDMQVVLKRIRYPLIKFDGVITREGKKALAAEGISLAFSYRNT